MQYMTFVEMQVKWSVTLTDRLGPEILTVLEIKGQLSKLNLLNFVPISKKSDEFTTRQDVEKFLRRVQLKAFFHNKEDESDNTEKDAFETLTAKKSKWAPPEGQFASIHYFIKKCRHDVHKLISNCNTKLSNLSKEEWLPS